MRFKGRIQRLAMAGVLSGIAMVGLIGTANSGATVRAHSGPSGTLTFPETNTDMTYIYPFFPLSQFNTTNAGFTSQDERPLFYFAAGNSTTFDCKISLASCNVKWNGTHTTVTVTMNGEKWSNGETVNAASALFFINMMKYTSTVYQKDSAVGTYGAYAPGVGIPDQVTAASASGNKLSITFSAAVNTTWAFDNALQVILPMPSSWDVAKVGAKAGSAGCEGNATYVSSTANGYKQYPIGTTTADKKVEAGCAASYKLMTGLAGGIGSNPTITKSNYNNSIWKVSDGPYVLSSFTLQPSDVGGGLPTFVANSKYSGPDKAQAKTLKFQYFDSTTAEVDALEAGTYGLATGGVPAEDVTNGNLIANPTNPSACSTHYTEANGCNGAWAGTNKISSIGSKYNVEMESNWGTSFAYMDFWGNADHQALMNQAYIRRALNLSIDQSGLITTVLDGYGAPDCNLLPQIADTYQNDVTCFTNHSANVTLAKSLLTSHNWDISSTPATCKTGGCGTGIPAGAKLNIDMDYPYSAGSDLVTEVSDISADWAAVGINMIQHADTTSTEIDTACFSGTASTYDVCLYGGWVYNPGVFVSGEQFALTNSGSDANNWGNPVTDCDIYNTIDLVEPASCVGVAGFTWVNPNTSAGLKTAVGNYADATGFTASNSLAPFLYLPNSFYAPLEVGKSLKWTGPPAAQNFGAQNAFANPVLNFLPEFIKP